MRVSILVLLALTGSTWAGEAGVVHVEAGCIEDEGRPRYCTDAYAFDRSEVTVDAYTRCVQAGACENPATQSGCSCLCNSDVPGRGGHPMNCVFYSNAEAYCRWNGQRLPTGVEWDKVATSTFGPWLSADPSCDSLHRGGCRFPAGALNEPKKDCAVRTDPVCSPRLGNVPDEVCDLAGNVSEFVSDWFWNEGGRAKHACIGRRGDACFLSVRGGSYQSGQTIIPRLAASSGFPMHTIQPPFQLVATGFRCVTPESAERNAGGAQRSPKITKRPASVSAESTGPLPQDSGLVSVPATCIISATSAGWNLCLDSFAIDRSEVTVDAYQRCVDAGRCRKACNRDPNCSTACNANGPGREGHPVNCVTLEDAQMYCQWNGQRLPYDVEWEVAALGSSSARRKFPWGDEAETCDRVVRQGCTIPATSTVRQDVSGTAPVCSSPGGNTPAGLCDAAGNVAEWTQSWAYDWMKAPKKWTRRLHGRQWIPRENPDTLVSTSEQVWGTGRLKGGSYLDSESYLRFDPKEFGVSVEKGSTKLPWLAIPAVGFRCVTDLPARQGKR